MCFSAPQSQRRHSAPPNQYPHSLKAGPSSQSRQKNSESSTCKRVPVPRQAQAQAWPWLPGLSWLLKSSGKGGAEEAWDLGKLTAEESARPSPGVRPDCAGHYPDS